METRDRHGATKRNIMALVMHAYLICGDVGEVHLIFSAILAAGLLAVDPGCVPPSCADMCGTAQKQKKKSETNDIDVGDIERHNTRTPPH
jgi:hypothetical protein